MNMQENVSDDRCQWRSAYVVQHRDKCRNLCANCILVPRRELANKSAVAVTSSENISKKYTSLVPVSDSVVQIPTRKGVRSNGSICTSESEDVIVFSSDEEDDSNSESKHVVTVDVHAEFFSADILPPVDSGYSSFSSARYEDFLIRPTRRQKNGSIVTNFIPELEVIESDIPVNPPKEVNIDMFLLDDLFQAQKEQNKRKFNFFRKKRDFVSEIEAVMNGQYEEAEEGDGVDGDGKEVPQYSEEGYEGEIINEFSSKKSKSARFRKWIKKLFCCCC